ILRKGPPIHEPSHVTQGDHSRTRLAHRAEPHTSKSVGGGGELAVGFDLVVEGIEGLCYRLLQPNGRQSDLSILDLRRRGMQYLGARGSYPKLPVEVMASREMIKEPWVESIRPTEYDSSNPLIM